MTATDQLGLLELIRTKQRALVDRWLAWLGKQRAGGSARGGNRPSLRQRHALRPHLEHESRTDEPGSAHHGFLTAYLAAHRPSSISAVIEAGRALSHWIKPAGLYRNISRTACAVRASRD